MSERLYARLLRLYPRAFRERYAEEMMQDFRGRVRDEGAARAWLDVLGDALVSIPWQHIRREPHPYYPLSAVPLHAAEALVVRGAVYGLFAGFAFTLIILIAFFAGVSKAWPLAAVLFVALGLRFRKCSRAIEALRTVHAEAGDDAVTVGYAGMAPLTLLRNEVTGLHEYQLVGLRIETADPARDLWVPFWTGSYAVVKAQVGEWASLKTTPHFLFRMFDSFPVLAVVLYALAVLTPLTFFGAAICLAVIVPQLFKRSAPLHRKLLVLGALAIHVARWLW